MNPFPDQNEVLAENASLKLRAAALRAEVWKTTGAIVAALDEQRFYWEVTKNTDQLQFNAGLKAHIAELQAMLEGKQAGTTTTTTAPKQSTSDALTAHKAMPLGMKSSTVHTTKAAPASGETLTARVLKAKGCKTLVELAQKPADNRD